MSNRVLNDILNDCIVLDDEKCKHSKKIVTELLDKLIPAMKQGDVTFRELYECTFYTGSFYDKLKVKTPDEFDLDLVLRFPVSETEIQSYDRFSQIGEDFGVYPGHAFYCSEKNPVELFNKNPLKYEDWKNFYKFFECKKNLWFVSPDKVKQWFTGVVRRGLNIMGDFNITIRQNGPAQTLEIKISSDSMIAIDLVPVFRNAQSQYDQVYLVPKSPLKETDILVGNEGLQWRISYSARERKLLKGNCCALKIIKLLKYIRDEQGPPLKKLCSYYLKHFVVLQLDKYSSWEEKNIGVRFLEILDGLEKCLESGVITSYFDDQYNILSTIDPVTVSNFSGRVRSILKDIKNHLDTPEYIRKYFEQSEPGVSESLGIPKVIFVPSKYDVLTPDDVLTPGYCGDYTDKSTVTKKTRESGTSMKTDEFSYSRRKKTRESGLSWGNVAAGTGAIVLAGFIGLSLYTICSDSNNDEDSDDGN